MTSETRTLIELADIKGVEFSCRKCGAKVLYPLDRHYDELLEQCPNCNKNWITHDPELRPDDPQPARQVANIVTAVRDLAKRKDICADVRLLVGHD